MCSNLMGEYLKQGSGKVRLKWKRNTDYRPDIDWLQRQNMTDGKNPPNQRENSLKEFYRSHFKLAKKMQFNFRLITLG